MIKKVEGRFSLVKRKVPREPHEFRSTWDRLFGDREKEVEGYQFESGQNYTAGLLPEHEYLSLLQAQTTTPQAVMRSDKYIWWMFQDEFYRADKDLSGIEVKALVLEQRMRREKRLKKALVNLELNEIPFEPSYTTREPIPEDVRIYVWRRDGGRCVKCGSKENLEFDHIIPYLRGQQHGAKHSVIVRKMQS